LQKTNTVCQFKRLKLKQCCDAIQNYCQLIYLNGKPVHYLPLWAALYSYYYFLIFTKVRINTLQIIISIYYSLQNLFCFPRYECLLSLCHRLLQILLSKQQNALPGDKLLSGRAFCQLCFAFLFLSEPQVCYRSIFNAN